MRASADPAHHDDRERDRFAWRSLLGTVLFTALVPGTVAGLVPVLLARGRIAGSAWQVAIGVALVAVGALLYARCAWDFATLGRGTPSPTAPPRALVARGPYRFSRNPMYVGVMLVVVGQAVRSGAPAVALYAAALATAFHLRVVLGEEPALRRAFGDAYATYAARVPRWAGRPAPRDEAS